MRYRVVPAVAPWMATQQACASQRAARQCAVPMQRLQRVGRARRLEATGVAQPRLQRESIRQHQRYERSARQIAQHLHAARQHGPPWSRQPGLVHSEARFRSPSSSLRASWRSNAGAADL